MNLPVLSNKTERVVELDALRALAAINLMLFHFTHVYQVKYGFTSPLGWEYPYGKYGVQLFFMLSGYVNAMTLLAKRQPLDFLAGRTIRILPSYLFVIGLNLILLLCLPFTLHGNYSAAQVAANLTIVPNLLGYECLEPVTWTLQIEVLFYGIILAMFCTGAMQRPLKPLMWYMAVCAAGTFFLDGLVSELPGTRAALAAETVRSMLLLPYMPLFAIGILLHQIRTSRGKLWWNGLGIVVASAVFHLIDARDHNPLVTVFFTGLLALSGYGKLPLLRFRPLVFLSGISYSLYLLHNNLGTAFIYYLNQVGLPPMVCFLLVLPFVVLLSVLATRCFERPISNWLRGAWKQARLRLPASWLAIPVASPRTLKTTT